MGLTIHFHGKLRSMASLPELGRLLERHAEGPDRKLHHIDDEEGELGKYLNADLVDVTGPLKGWILAPPEGCEPLFFVFDRQGRMACSCKTQFAPLDVHKWIVALLEEVEPFFDALHVNDEGGFWGTHDDAELLARRDRLDQLIGMVAGAFKHGRPRAEPPDGHDLN